MTTTQPVPTAGKATIATTGPPPTTDRDLRRSALVAGVGILVMAVLAGAANFGAIQGLVTDGDATRTAKDILASDGLFRLGIAAMVVVVVLDVVVAWALLRVFSTVHAALSRLSAWLRLAYAAVFMVALSQLARIPALLTNADGTSERPVNVGDTPWQGVAALTLIAGVLVSSLRLRRARRAKKGWRR